MTASGNYFDFVSSAIDIKGEEMDAQFRYKRALLLALGCYHHHRHRKTEVLTFKFTAKCNMANRYTLKSLDR